jgi:chaperonin GroEL
LALHNAKKVLDDVELEDIDEQLGIEILKGVLSEPLKQIAENAGQDGAVVAANCTETKGYNAKTGEYVNMIEEGIIDPVKVTRFALINGASVGTMLITTEAVVAEIKSKDELDGAANPAQMGGMM